MTTMRGRAIVSIAGLVALIGCGSSEPPETESTAAEDTARTIQITTQPRPFRITGNQIITDTFDVRYDLRDGRLAVALDTDLGDAAKLMVSVSRSYWEQGTIISGSNRRPDEEGIKTPHLCLTPRVSMTIPMKRELKP